jgi:GntR family transcriptional regulator, transcriptional repressor for pyruvate dehydrogenase complex
MAKAAGRKLAARSESTSTNAIVDALRERILSVPEGVFLGSEAVLLAEYGVSRPTFRQVARVLEQEELLTVRRGIGGGYYVRRPSLEMVGAVSGNYLRAHHLTLADIYEVLTPVADLMYRKVASSNNGEGRRKLVEMRRRFIDLLDANADFASYLALDLERTAVMSEMAENPLIGLQMSVLYQLARGKIARSGNAPAREYIQQYIRLRIRLLDAILAREAEVAVAVGRLLISAIREAGAAREHEEM